MFPILLLEFLGVFLNTLSAKGKYLIEDCQNLPLPVQMQLSEKRKTFSVDFVPFQILNILRQKMMVKANVFPKLNTEKLCQNFL